MKKLIIFGMMFLSFACFASAGNYFFQPSSVNGTDNMITSDGPTTVYKAGPYGWQVDNNYFVLANFNFSCDSLNGETATSVILQLYLYENDAGSTMTLYPMTSAWSEDTVTWNNCGTGGCAGAFNSSYALGSLKVPSGTGMFNITLNTTWYNDECANPSTQRFGFICKDPYNGVDSYVASENADPLLRPALYVTTNDLDSTPPVLSAYNCTSCNPPIGDVTSPYDTDDTTPTFKFNTNENAYCAIGAANQNYTTMGAARNCTTGEGTTSHTCTLTAGDALSTFPDYLYISCKDSSGNEGTTSSSGALEIGLYGLLKGNVTDSIGRAVSNALVLISLNNTNSTMYNRTSNSTGRWSVDWTRFGIYTVCAYKPTNYTLRGDCTPFIQVS